MPNGANHDMIYPGDSALCATNPGWIHIRDNVGCYGNTACAITTVITCLARLVIFFLKRKISIVFLRRNTNKMTNVNWQASTALGKGGTTSPYLAWPMAHHGLSVQIAVSIYIVKQTICYEQMVAILWLSYTTDILKCWQQGFVNVNLVTWQYQVTELSVLNESQTTM